MEIQSRVFIIGHKERVINFENNSIVEFEVDNSTIQPYINHFGLNCKLSNRPQYIMDIYAKSYDALYFYNIVDKHSANMCIRLKSAEDDPIYALIHLKKLNFSETDLDKVASAIYKSITVGE